MSSKWRHPNINDLPPISSIEAIGLDTETYDPDLIEGGPGWGRHYGHMVGLSIAIHGDKSYYFPLKHIVEPEDNMPDGPVLKYMQELLLKPIPKVGANLMYDVGWLMESGLEIVGPFYDVQFAEALLDPSAYSYSLDRIAKKYLGESKESNELYEWCASKYPGVADAKQRANIYRSPPRIVGPYAEADADLPLRILPKQETMLELAGLLDLFKMECELIPLLVKMRMRGVTVDLMAAHEARDDLTLAEKIMQQQLNDIAGFGINVNSSKDLSIFYDRRGLKYPLTAKGNPSFTAPWLAAQHTKEATMINNIRKTRKARGTFVENAIIEKALNNKVYPSLHPLRSDDGGTITGRFSCSKPNGQQIPSRDEEMAPLIRGMFIPDPGYPSWLTMDFSQIEYRMFAHYSGDDNLISKYQERSTDFHQIVGDSLGENIPRKPVKNLNFMMIYGGGFDKLIQMLSEMELDTDPKAFLRLYHEKFPAAKKLMKSISEEAGQTGEIRTILNRRTTFELWVPKQNTKSKPLPYAAAFHTYGGNLVRANTYKALNYKLQGSAADLIKKGMLDAYNSGIFDKIGYPHLQVHDELNFSYHPDLRREFLELIEMMEVAIPLKVPVIMTAKTGPNWGAAKNPLD